MLSPRITFRAWWQEAPTDNGQKVGCWTFKLDLAGMCLPCLLSSCPLASGLLSQFPHEPEPANLGRVERTAVLDEYLGSYVCCALDSLRVRVSRLPQASQTQKARSNMAIPTSIACPAIDGENQYIFKKRRSTEEKKSRNGKLHAGYLYPVLP